MPILKNAKKKVKVIKNKNVSNSVYKTSMQTAIKNVEKAIEKADKTKAKETLDVAIKKIDKAVRKGVIHQNKAARHKTKLSKSVNNMK